MSSVLIRRSFLEVCGSDLHAYLATVPKIPTATDPNELTGETLPITLGHEFSGTIVDLGIRVDESKWVVGQNVIVEPVISCLKTDTCQFCAAGTRNVCPSANFIGIGGWGGGLAEYIAVDTRYVHILPDGVSCIGGWCNHRASSGSLVRRKTIRFQAQADCAYRWRRTYRIIFFSKFLATILVSEPALIRRQFSLKHGATIAIDPLIPSASGSPSPMTVPTAVLQATGGLGVDVAFDAAGIQASIDSALLSIRPQGVFVNVAIWEEIPRVHMNLIVLREIVVTGTIAYTGIHKELLEAVAAGNFPGIEELITRKIAIEDVVDQGIMALLHEKDKQFKILVHP